jgi:hypothetical protein
LELYAIGLRNGEATYKLVIALQMHLLDPTDHHSSFPNNATYLAKDGSTDEQPAHGSRFFFGVIEPAD